MANNSYVTSSGHEIGRAQGIQAVAARVPAEVAMNPILLKPTGDRTSQVIVSGVPIGHLSAAEYHSRKPELLGTVLETLADLRLRFDVVICEGAGSPTEINLLSHDIVNLRIAFEAKLPAVVIGDINPGGVFAALFGTVALLPDHLRACVKGFVINKFRGDPALLFDGTAQLESACGVPTFGVLPWINELSLDAEDSMSLPSWHNNHATGGGGLGDSLDIAVIRLPRIANFTDFDPLGLEPGVNIRFVEHRSVLGQPDLLVIPGSKATVDDLAWMREQGFVAALNQLNSTHILGICAGYQMLGWSIEDSIESGAGLVDGLGLLPVATRFELQKITRQREATALGHNLSGYQIHHGRVVRQGEQGEDWMLIKAEDSDGVSAVEVRQEVDGRMVAGTTLHGLFESDDFRSAFLSDLATRVGKVFVPSGVSFAARREEQIDRFADAIEQHVDVDRILELIATGTLTSRSVVCA